MSRAMKAQVQQSSASAQCILRQQAKTSTRSPAPVPYKPRTSFAGQAVSLKRTSASVARTSKLELNCTADSFIEDIGKNSAFSGKPQDLSLGSPQSYPGSLRLGGLDDRQAVQHPKQSRLRLFSGTANPQLSQEVACYMGLDLGHIKIKRFADGEIYVQIQESIRGCDVFLIQPTCPPANDHVMELLVMIDACRRASARSITAVMPYFGYARADRKTSGRESIAAKLVANMITEAGADRLVSVDLHSGQCVGYFDIPVDHVYGQCVILDYLSSKILKPDDVVVVSPDVGGVARARSFAKKLNDAPLAIIDKRRTAHNVAEVMNLIGDVEGKVAIMVDDMIDTAGTLCGGAKLLHEMGAREVVACCTHGLFSGPAVERLSSGLFQEVIITNTIPITKERMFPQLTVLSVGNLLGETIWRVHNDTSVAGMSVSGGR